MFYPRVGYYTTTNISLSLEGYHNEGLTPQETREVIETIYDPAGNDKFHCTPGGINQNWSIRTWGHSTECIEEIIELIQIELDLALVQKRLLKKGKKKFDSATKDRTDKHPLWPVLPDPKG